MADTTTIVGISDGVLKQALTDVPPWATEDTLGKIKGMVTKSAASNASIEKILKTLSKSSLDPKKFQELDDQLDNILKDFKDQHKRHDDKKKDDKEDRDHHLKSTKLWKLLTDKQYLLNESTIVLTGTFKAIVGAMQSNVKTFDHLYESGIAVTTASDGAASAFDSLRQMSVLAGMSVTQFGKILENSTGANALGAVRFAKTLPIVSKNLQQFGYDVQQAAQITGAYLDTLGGFTSVQSKSQEEIEEGATVFGKSLSRLSLITGMSRQKILDNTAAIASSTDASVIAATQGEKAATNFSAFAASFKDPAIGQQFIKMMSSKLPALNATFQNFAKAGLGPMGMQVMKFTKSLAGLSPERAALATKNFVDSLGDLGPIINQQQLLAEAGVEGAEENLKILTGLRQQANASKNLNEADLKKIEDSAEASAKIRSAWMGIMGTFSNIFSPTLSQLTKLGDGLEFVNTKLQAISKWMNETPFLGLNASVADATKYIVGFGAAALIALKSLQVIGAARGFMGGGAAGGIAGKAAGGIGEGIGKGSSGMLKGLAEGLGALGSPRVLLGVVTLAGLAGTLWIAGKGLQEFANVSWDALAKAGVTLVALGLAGAAAGAAAPLLLAGAAAFLVLGAALWVVGKGVESFGSGINVLADASKAVQIGKLKELVGVVNSIDLLKAAAFGILGGRLSTPSAPNPSSAISVPKSPAASTINTPSATPADPNRVKSGASNKTDAAQATGPGIEKPPSTSDINSVLTYQTSLMEQLLIATNNNLSVNKDILKYSKNHS